MNCPECNNVLSKRYQCDKCGDSAKVYIRIVKASNMYYNDGLKKAKVRDLTGAITSLKESLKLYKKNTAARNLLGLIYYEVGETVAAISEWVISKHFQDDNNDADEYMNDVQSNPTKLDMINQSVKRYNAALISAKSSNEDLAIIQLKKVISLNPHFIRAHQLLAILYLKVNEKEKARKCLLKVSKIDVTNTITLAYLQEIGISQVSQAGSTSLKRDNSSDYNSTTSSIIPVSSYKEDKPNIMAFINLILGVLIGVAVVYVLIIPTIRKNIEAEVKTTTIDYSEQLNTQSATIDSLEKEKITLQDVIDQQKKEIDGFEIVEYDETIYDNLFLATKLYLEGEKAKSAEKLLEVKEDVLARPGTLDIFNFIKADIFPGLSTESYKVGYNLYSKSKYEDALVELQLAVDYDGTNVDALYFLGRTYQRLTENEKAKEYYNILVEDYSNTSRATEARARLNEIN